MSEDVRDNFMLLHGGLLSSYPRLSDVEWNLQCDRVPFFEVKYDDGQIRSYAIVRPGLAQAGLAYNQMLEKLDSTEMSSDWPAPLFVFKAIKPVVKFLLDQDDYVTLSQLISGFFLQLNGNGDGNMGRSVRVFKEFIGAELHKTSDAEFRAALKSSLALLDEYRG